MGPNLIEKVKKRIINSKILSPFASLLTMNKRERTSLWLLSHDIMIEELIDFRTNKCFPQLFTFSFSFSPT